MLRVVQRSRQVLVVGLQLIGMYAASPGPHRRHPSNGAAQPAGLSHRELEVLALLNAGHSNKAIAERLVIGEPTVATHVRHILDKTGSANRTEAAVWAERHK